MARDSADVIVIGAGIMGLWSAWMALEAGLSVLVLERNCVGAGASGGMIGALAPHLPDRWNAKKQYQFEALCALEHEIRAVEETSGLSTGYGRIGRIQPLSGGGLARAEERLAGAQEFWGDTAQMSLVPANALPEWADPKAGEAWLHDTLTARVDPRALLVGLAKAITRRGGQIVTGVTVESISPGEITTKTDTYRAPAIILAAGVPAFDLIAPLVGENPGRAEKGQALLLGISAPVGVPLIYGNGTYVLPHANGKIAVGATSERQFDDPNSNDTLLDESLNRARALCPWIGTTEPIERWAGLRPRGNGREPMLGAIPNTPGVYAMMAGFKISFGIAAKAARDVLNEIQTGTSTLPETFRVPHHLGKGD